MRLCCKKFQEDKMSREQLYLFSLSHDSEQIALVAKLFGVVA
jgi:hypothetical protein